MQLFEESFLLSSLQGGWGEGGGGGGGGGGWSNGVRQQRLSFSFVQLFVVLIQTVNTAGA